jgi:hypothetical protein
MNLLRLVLSLFAILSAGCAKVVSSGINQLGPETYAVTVQASRSNGGLVGAEGIALEEAGDFCRRSNTTILVLTREPLRGATFRATFRCLAAGDPDLKRPEIQLPPDRIIEQRRR